MPVDKEREETLLQKCINKYSNFPFEPGAIYCNNIFDGYLCWQPTQAGKIATQNCPSVRLSDTKRSAYRICGDNGLWLTRKGNESSVVGWTNYTPCFPAEVQSLFVKVYDNEKDAQAKFEIAQTTRYLEIVGFSISLLALIVSLIIFTYYRSLRNSRTRIHKSLFSAMILQVVIRLTLYIDQAITRKGVDDLSTSDNTTVWGIDNMPYLCESAYILLEYAISVMFMWMFIEGLYLHNVVTANALRVKISHLMHCALGWGLPILLTALWAAVTAYNYDQENVKKCWYGYNFSPIYWIIQGPRLAVIMVNFVFLLSIMRVILLKLRETRSTEVQKIKKAVRAALVLLPLLGITNLLNMTEAPLDGSLLQFGLWSYSIHFFRSFQGLLIALIYCFFNGEVCLVIKKHYYNYKTMRADRRNGRNSIVSCLFGGNFNGRNRGRRLERKPTWAPMRIVRWTSSTVNNPVSDTEMIPETSRQHQRENRYFQRCLCQPGVSCYVPTSESIPLRPITRRRRLKPIRKPKPQPEPEPIPETFAVIESDDDIEVVQPISLKIDKAASDDDASSQDTDTNTNIRGAAIMEKAVSTTVTVDINPRNGELSAIMEKAVSTTLTVDISPRYGEPSAIMEKAVSTTVTVDINPRDGKPSAIMEKAVSTTVTADINPRNDEPLTVITIADDDEIKEYEGD